MENLCRLCAKEKPIKQLVHSIGDQQLNIEHKLNDCCRWSSIVSYEYDELPKKICNACYRKLESSWSFADSVAQAQKHLFTLIENIKPELAPIEYVSAAEIKDEPSGSIDTDELSAEEEEIESNELLGMNDTIEEFNVSLKSQNTNSTTDYVSPLLEDDYEIMESNNSKQNEVDMLKDEPKPKKKRYDSRKIDFDEVRRKRLQRLPGSLSRLCDTCGREFASVNALRRHNLIHLGQEPHARPHECKTCGKRFRTRFNLKVSKIIEIFIGNHKNTDFFQFIFQTHENIHTGAKPYLCKLCDYRSSCGQNLGKHTKEKHQIVKTKRSKSSKL